LVENYGRKLKEKLLAPVIANALRNFDSASSEAAGASSPSSVQPHIHLYTRRQEPGLPTHPLVHFHDIKNFKSWNDWGLPVAKQLLDCPP
jgi:hypothetical protein